MRSTTHTITVSDEYRLPLTCDHSFLSVDAIARDVATSIMESFSSIYVVVSQAGPPVCLSAAISAFTRAMSLSRQAVRVGPGGTRQAFSSSGKWDSLLPATTTTGVDWVTCD